MVYSEMSAVEYSDLAAVYFSQLSVLHILNPPTAPLYHVMLCCDLPGWAFFIVIFFYFMNSIVFLGGGGFDISATAFI